jgi:zinc transport system permease protein
LVVNVSIKTVGVLLINALLVLPAATAGNLSRNLRTFFWYSIALSVFSGLTGLVIIYSWDVTIKGNSIQFGLGGMIIMVAVLLFFLSMAVGKWLRGARPALRTGF